MSTHTNNPVAKAIRLALFAGLAGTSVTGVAFAADQAAGDEEIERIEVTGSRIKRTDVEGAQPVFVINRENIEKSGVTTAGELLQEIPSVAGAATNPAVNNGGGDGSATVSLRGAGSARTLVLMNGRRLMGGITDINTIPLNIIERVEVLKDGASAIYGSDAVAGVVNFITRRDFEGVDATVRYGQSSESDANLNTVSVTAGTSSEKGNLVLGMSWSDQKEVSAADRDFSKAPLALYSGAPITFGSSRTPTGFIRVPASNTLGLAAGVYTRVAGTAGTQASHFRRFQTTGATNDFYNFQPSNVVLTPQERTSFFAQGNYDLGNNVEYFGLATYTNTEAGFQIAPEAYDARPQFANIPISAQSIYNPFGTTITDFRWRAEAVGDRTSDNNRHNLGLTNGLRGTFGDSWSWDASYLWSEEYNANTLNGEFYSPGLKAAQGPSFIDASGVARCGTPTAIIGDCTPVNLIGAGSDVAIPADQLAALKALAPNFHDNTEQHLQVAEANLTGDIVDLPAGPLSVATGVQYRWEDLEFQPDYLRESGLASGGVSGAVKGEFDVNEMYAEFNIPLLSDAPFAEYLGVNIGSRYSDYSNFGSTTNSKISLEYRPMSELLLRSTYAEVFRAPSVNDLFSGQSESADTYNDPCNQVGGVTPSLPGCAGVPAHTQTDSQTNARVGGNTELKPETGEVLTAGFVYSPSWLENFSTTVDWYSIELESAIGAPGTQNIVNLCANSLQFCDKVTRDATGEVIGVANINANIGVLDLEGLDWNIRYVFPETAFGSFKANLDTSYLIQSDTQAVAGVDSTLLRNAGRFRESSAGGDGHFARWRALGTLGWNYGDFEANWKLRYVHHVVETATDGATGEDVNLTVPSYTYNDLQVSYNFSEFNTRLSLGVDNIADKQPPLIYTGFNATTDVRTYDTIGRFYYAQAQVRF